MRNVAIALPLLLCLAACKVSDKDASEADPEATVTAVAAKPANGVPAGTALPLTAQAFVDAAAASDKFEIESARIVQGAGPGQPLTAFTQMMLRDHQASTDALKTAANAAGGSAFPDNQNLTEEQKGNLEALRSAGKEMAALYIRQQIAAHEQTLAILKNYAASGDNPALMAFAAKAAPVVSHHLAEARKLQ